MNTEELTSERVGHSDHTQFSFPAFEPCSPWWGADLQTLRNAIVPPQPIADHGNQRRVHLPMTDGSGDELTALLDTPNSLENPSSQSLPLIVLIHGLSGSEDSAYVLTSTRFWLARGHCVLRLNLRGAGPSRARCHHQYHAGRTKDLRDALSSLAPHLTERGLIPIGYSLGGNMLLKFMAEYAEQFPIIAAASVSAPIDLAAASRRFLDLRNWVYHRHLLSSMKRECFGGKREIGPDERRRIMESRSILQFDEEVVAPRNGFRDAAHYYHENNARRFLADIQKPTLLLHSLDDPWIPAQAYTEFPWHKTPQLVPVLAKGGGHVGFHSERGGAAYHDQCIGLFVDRILQEQQG